MTNQWFHFDFGEALSIINSPVMEVLLIYTQTKKNTKRQVFPELATNAEAFSLLNGSSTGALVTAGIPTGEVIIAL